MSEKSETIPSEPGRFSWNELITTDANAAKAFYKELFGWTSEPFGAVGGYTLLKKGDTGVGGLMQAPTPGMPAQWLAYVTVEDVDATAAKTAELRGKVLMPPFDVAEVGRIAILMDAQGAAFGIFKPLRKSK